MKMCYPEKRNRQKIFHEIYTKLLVNPLENIIHVLLDYRQTFSAFAKFSE